MLIEVVVNLKKSLVVFKMKELYQIGPQISLFLSEK